MTPAEALGRLLIARYDGKELTGHERAEVMEMIPPQCRFVDSDFHIETPATIRFFLDRLEHLKQHPPPPFVPRFPDDFDYDLLDD